MAWWSRVKRQSQTHTAPQANVLVISDIHLGEDILVGGPELLHTYIRTLNGTLMGFLQAHSAACEDGRLWHLVINGDMFDFVKMPLEDRERAGARPGTEHEALRKLERILRIHRPFFMAMAQFLVAGHSITIVEGNHDAEFYFEGVRGALRQEMVRLAAQVLRRQGASSHSAHGCGARLAYSSWFVAEMGHYHIEHGHQYDPFCSFEHKLAPLDVPLAATADAVLMQPMSHRLLPRVAELLGNFSTHGITDMRLVHVVRLLHRLGFAGSWQLIVCYSQLAVMLLTQAGKKRQRALARMAAHQASRLRILGEESCYSAGVLRALDKRKAKPAEYALAKMMHLFWLDRLALGLVGVLIALTWTLGFGASVGQGLGIVVLFAACCTALSHFNPPPMALVLREAAAHIAQVTGAQYIIFGHSHKPECIDLHATFGVGRDALKPRYLNGGSWVTREILRGDATEGMTYVKITGRGAQLMRWRGRDKDPVCLGDTGQPSAPSGVHTVPQAS